MNMTNLHVYIIILHVHIKSYVDIIYLACSGQQISTIFSLSNIVLFFVYYQSSMIRHFAVCHCYDYLTIYYNNYIITIWSNSPEFLSWHKVCYLYILLCRYFIYKLFRKPMLIMLDCSKIWVIEWPRYLIVWTILYHFGFH